MSLRPLSRKNQVRRLPERSDPMTSTSLKKSYLPGSAANVPWLKWTRAAATIFRLRLPDRLHSALRRPVNYRTYRRMYKIKVENISECRTRISHNLLMPSSSRADRLSSVTATPMPSPSLQLLHNSSETISLGHPSDYLSQRGTTRSIRCKAVLRSYNMIRIRFLTLMCSIINCK